MPEKGMETCLLTDEQTKEKSILEQNPENS